MTLSSSSSFVLRPSLLRFPTVRSFLGFPEPKGFLDLPLEVRSTIYAYALPRHIECDVSSSRRGIGVKLAHHMPDLPQDVIDSLGLSASKTPDLNKVYALLSTNKRVREEALSYLEVYGHTVLRIFCARSELPPSLQNVPVLLRTIVEFMILSPGQRSPVKFLDLDLLEAPRATMEFRNLQQIFVQDLPGAVATGIRLDSLERKSGKVSEEDSCVIMDTALRTEKRRIAQYRKFTELVERRDGGTIIAKCMAVDHWVHEGECSKSCAFWEAGKHRNDLFAVSIDLTGKGGLWLTASPLQFVIFDLHTLKSIDTFTLRASVRREQFDRHHFRSQRLLDGLPWE